MNFKGMFAGIVLVILLGVAGFLYRSITEEPKGPIACTADAKLCPDGTGLGRTGPECTFPACPPPNIELSAVGLAFALPAGYVPQITDDPEVLGTYQKINSATGIESNLTIRRFDLPASTTAATFIRQNALLDPSGMQAPATAIRSEIIGDPQHQHPYSIVEIGRFEGIVDTAYYLKYGNDKVIRFDALSRNVMDWTDPHLDVTKLPANLDLRTLLSTLQGS